ncbi:hypothetical protein E4U55_007252 [Claviceps digitariae]|nr:hypothetical protein E4U55_007252 [Claviceps digitariae]
MFLYSGGADTQAMMASAVAMMPTNVSRESVSRIHRITKENRSLWYQLTVLQQPERARACGSGMKANSDRRPVDPPPVVELRVIEGPTVEEGKDVTFDYNANFFLYASLEQARSLAHGRVQSAAATNPPILTGVPASGMAYLDRPAEAGYFIFPDLSVRHEGYFRLAFSLFETTKEERDFDMEPGDSDLPPGVDWRMEIKTQPFNVFSAKKFPGLMESTQLSKTVADQGCRVRIRRDVRMRKRDGKGAAFERRDDEYRRRTVTPSPDDLHSIRARSLSNSSEHCAAYGTDGSRRPSGVDIYHPAAQPPPPPPPHPHSAGYDSPHPQLAAGGHVLYSEHGAAQPPPPPPSHYANARQYVMPPQTPAQHMTTSTQSSVPSSAPSSVPSSTPSAPSYPSALSSPYTKPESSNYGYAHHGRSLSSTCPSPTPSVRAPDVQYERNPGGYVQPSTPPGTGHAQSRRNSSQQASSDSGLQDKSQPPPPPPPPPPHHPTKSSAPSTTTTTKMASTTTPSLAPLKIAQLVSPCPLSPIEPQSRHAMALSTLLGTGDKRKRDHVFPQALRPLHNGQRQDEAQFCRLPSIGFDSEGDKYARADGQVGMLDFRGPLGQP